VGLKVDSDALPEDLKKQLAAGEVNLDDPATTIALLKLNAIVGVTAFANPDGSVKSMGIQCAFCHSTVDDSFAPGIGKRLDGWPNRDLNVGAIVSLAPNLKPFTDLLGVDVETVKKVLASWGPGRYDAELNKDGKATGGFMALIENQKISARKPRRWDDGPTIFTLARKAEILSDSIIMWQGTPALNTHDPAHAVDALNYLYSKGIINEFEAGEKMARTRRFG
jgi:hypothetical protein